MEFSQIEHVWGRFALVAAIVGALYFGFTYVRDQQQDAERGAAHRADAHEQTVQSVVQDLAEQRQSDEQFRREALDTIGEGFTKHDERISGLEDASKETRFLIREQRTLRQVERERLDRLEDEQKEQAERTLEAIEAVRERPLEVVVPAPEPASPSP